MRMARKPSAIARELLRNFPKGGKRRRKRNNRKRKGAKGAAKAAAGSKNGSQPDVVEEKGSEAEMDLAGAEGDTVAAGGDDQ